MRAAWSLWIPVFAGMTAVAAQAAGGHHAIDDAALVETGLCEIESWAARDSSRGHLLHAGASCRVSDIELGLFTERARQDGDGSNDYGVQVKMAREWLPGLSAGLSLQAAWDSHQQPRYRGTTAIGLLTWAARDDLNVHLNVGRDFVHQGVDLARSGVAFDWMATSRWMLMAERYLEDQTHFVRAGTRWFTSDRFSLDLSRAQNLRGPKPSNWTLGAVWTVGR
jgi:hypothetical protein